MSTEIVRREQRGVVPRTLGELEQLARACVASNFFQDAREAGQAMIKIQAGAELGLPPVQSMTNINVIKGRITLSAGLMAALLKRAGYKIRVRWSDAPICCTVAVFEGGELVGESSFSTEDAKQAQLGGANWQKYPRNMLYARAVSNAARWYAPEVLTGCYLPDELEDAPADLRPAEPIVTPSDIGPAGDKLTVDPDTHPGEGWQRANRRIRAIMRDVGVSNPEAKACIHWLYGATSSKDLHADALDDLADALEHAPDPTALANDIEQLATLLGDAPTEETIEELRHEHCDTAWRLIALERALAGGEG